MRIILLTIIVSLFLSFSFTAYSQTADEMPPAEETVCDSFEGAAFGLCNAYCEAMDCDGLDPQASENACNKVLQKFENEIGEPMPPCSPPNVCSEAIIEQCASENKVAETIICNGMYICSHELLAGHCTSIGCLIPQ